MRTDMCTDMYMDTICETSSHCTSTCVCVRACMHVCMRVCVCAIDSDETLATQEVHPQSHNVECARTYIYACGTA